KIMSLKKILIFLLASCLALVPLLSGCIDDDDDDKETKTLNVSQQPVKNATVFWDANSNFERDSGENVAVYNENDSGEGNYTIEVPKDNVGGQLVAVNGKVGDSEQKSLIMIAPKEARNITPVTTMVKYLPNLKENFGSNWDADIADEDGIDGKILQLALSAETMQSVLARQANETIQLTMVSQFAKNLQGKDLEDDTTYSDAAEAALAGFSDQLKEGFSSTPESKFLALNSTIVSGIDAVCDAIDASDSNVKESDILKEVKNQVYNKVGVQFEVDAEADLNEQILPLPNSLLWDFDKVSFPTASDSDKEALYTALEELELEGLSPNTPITIPLSNASVSLNSTSLNSTSIKVINPSKLYDELDSKGYTPANDTLDAIITTLSDDFVDIEDLQGSLDLSKVVVDNFEFVKDGKYIKAYPTEPLKPGTDYLVAVTNDIILDGTTSSSLAGSPEFNILKKEELPQAVEDELTTSQKQLRKEYATFYDYILDPLEIQRDDTLEIFSFATANATLSLDDFLAMSNENYDNITGLDLNSTINPNPNTVENFKDEFFAMNSTIQWVADSNVPLINNATNSSFTTWEVDTIPSANKTTQVPYKIYNQENYSSDADPVLVFQHGIFSNKTAAKYLESSRDDITIISMDLPKHGDRSASNEPSGARYFTPDIAQDRINFYQSYYDMTVLLKALNDGKFDVNGTGTANSPSNIYFVSQSLGSILGATVIENYNNAVDKAVLNVGGANLATIIDQTQHEGLNAVIEDDTSGLGLEKDTTEYFVFMGILQLLMDPADPVNWVEGLDNTILTTAYKDTTVSNISSATLANVAGFQPESLETFPLNITPEDKDWYMFGGKDPANEHWLPHSFMLHDEDGELDLYKQEYVEGGHDAVNTLIDDYLGL
ncbi:MAG: hypothetical protein ACOCZ2_03415, partial [Thermodesulfobacteriota bacterium]